jgi:thiol-disulfide isomerase/thioredoxin
LESVSLVAAGLILNSADAMAQAPSQRPKAPMVDIHAGTQQNTPRTLGGGLKDLNPYAEDAETVAARYRVPETNSVDDLMAFIIYLRSFEAHDTQTYLIHRKQMPIAVKAAAEKIVKLEKASYKPTAEQPEPTTNAYHQASMLILVAQVQMLVDLPPAEQRELFLQIKKRLEVTHAPQADFLLAVQLATRLESTPNTALAAEAYGTFAKLLSESSNEEIADLGKTFVAAARRLNLVGRPMEVVGRTLDGQRFDWTAYRGKVVLIDYWATWCKPCRDEMPNVKELYRLYHSRGFDVVGVNVDENRAEADAFVKAEGIPWVNLFDTVGTGDNAEHPMSAYYGVMGYPTVILVGKDGNVVALDARGNKLKELLAKMLGPAGSGPGGGSPAGGGQAGNGPVGNAPAINGQPDDTRNSRTNLNPPRR